MCLCPISFWDKLYHSMYKLLLWLNHTAYSMEVDQITLYIHDVWRSHYNTTCASQPGTDWVVSPKLLISAMNFWCCTNWVYIRFRLRWFLCKYNVYCNGIMWMSDNLLWQNTSMCIWTWHIYLITCGMVLKFDCFRISAYAYLQFPLFLPFCRMYGIEM